MNNTSRAAKIVRYLPHATALLLLVVLVVTVSAAVSSSHADAGVRAQGRAARIATCRSAYRSDIDQASSERADAESVRIDAISDLILAGRDEAARERGIVELNMSRVKVERARAKVARVNRVNRAAVRLSGRDPAAFLRSARCRKS